MPRGGRSRGRSASPIRPAPPRTVAHPPAPINAQRAPVSTQPQKGEMAPSRGPGLFGQMAATAGGVAIGSALGHAVGAAMTGGSRQPDDTQQEQQPPQQQQYQQEPYQQQQQGGACRYELQEFLNCAQSQHDITLCEGFNEALKQCKMSQGIQ